MYGRLVDNKIEYFKPYKGGLLIEGKIHFNAKESKYNEAGWYRIQNVAKDGIDTIMDNVLYHYIGEPKVYEPTKEDQIATLKQRLSDTDYCVIKIAEGVATKEEYADILAERAELRKQINELEV